MLASADVVIHDRLVSAAILDLAPPAARRLYVGKRKANHALPQGDVNDLLVALAREGLCVVRLKGGDPFVFGRGGEELLACRSAGVVCEVVPGVSAAIAAAAEVGAPLTHRSLSQAVTFVTGHAAVRGDGAVSEPDLNWSALAAANHTIAVYMGVSTAAMIAERLMEAGRAGSTPVVVVEDVSLGTGRRLVTTLQELPADIVGVSGPAVILIGEIAAMADLGAVGAAPSGRTPRSDHSDGPRRSQARSQREPPIVTQVYHALTANRLTDGVVVFWSNGLWGEQIP